MNWPKLSKIKAVDKFNYLFPEGGDLICPKVNNFPNQLQIIRQNLVDTFNEADKLGKKEFGLDITMSLKIYELLKPNDVLPMRVASSNEFWYWISLELIPDLVFRRYKGMNTDNIKKRYYERTLRIWPFMLWWGAHLTWQGDREKTLEVLNNGFTVTAYETLLDRCGNGYREDLFRAISLKFSQINKEYMATDKEFLRPVIVFNTSRIINVEPTFYDGGIEGYVESLFEPFVSKLKKKKNNFI